MLHWLVYAKFTVTEKYDVMVNKAGTYNEELINIFRINM